MEHKSETHKTLSPKTEGKDKERDKTKKKSNRWRKEKKQREEILNY